MRTFVAQTVTIGEQKVSPESESLKLSATPTPQVQNPSDSDSSTPTPQPCLLQHSCCRSHPVSHTSASTMLTGHTSLHPGVALNICIELSQRYSGFVSLNFRRASLIYSANSEHSALTFGPYTCIKHRERSNKFNLTCTPS